VPRVRRGGLSGALRVRFTWQDDNTLKLETDSGQQVRLLHFGPAPSQKGERTWQGYSAAEWFKQAQSAGLGGAVAAAAAGISPAAT
jgi:hypothetical protein